MRQNLTQTLALFRMRRAHNCQHIRVSVFPSEILTPLLQKSADDLIEGLPLRPCRKVLNLTASGIGCLDQHHDSLIILLHRSEIRLHGFHTQIRIQRYKVLMKNLVFLILYRRASDMSRRVSLRRGSDVTALDVAYNDQSLGAGIFYRPYICRHTSRAIHLIHGNLRLDCRNQIIDRVNDLLVETEKGFRRAFRRLSVLRVCFLLNVFRNHIQTRVQTHHCRIAGLPNFFH